MTNTSDTTRLKELRKQVAMGALHAKTMPGLWSDLQFVLDLFDRCQKAHAQLRAELDTRNRQSKDYAANAAIMLTDLRFRTFVAETHRIAEPERQPELVEMAVKRELGIRSKRELNTDTAVAERWRALVQRFETWKRDQTRGEEAQRADREGNRQ